MVDTLDGIKNLMVCMDMQQKMIDSLRVMLDVQHKMLMKTSDLAMLNTKTIKALEEQVEARWGGG